MKTKTFKTILVAAILGFSLFTSVKIIKSYYGLFQTDFLLHAKGQTQHFINSYIN